MSNFGTNFTEAPGANIGTSTLPQSPQKVVTQGPGTTGLQPITTKNPKGGGGNPDKIAAQIATEQYNDYVKTYYPYENQQIKELTDPVAFGAKVDEIGTNAGEQFDAAAGATNRDLSRYGYTLTPDQQKSFDKIRNIGRSIAVGNAENQGRDQLKDLRLQGLTNLADLFQNQAADAAGVAGSLSKASAQRDATNANIKAGNTAQTLGTLGTLASIGALIAIH